MENNCLVDTTLERSLSRGIATAYWVNEHRAPMNAGWRQLVDLGENS